MRRVADAAVSGSGSESRQQFGLLAVAHERLLQAAATALEVLAECAQTHDFLPQSVDGVVISLLPLTVSDRHLTGRVDVLLQTLLDALDQLAPLVDAAIAGMLGVRSPDRLQRADDAKAMEEG